MRGDGVMPFSVDAALGDCRIKHYDLRRLGDYQQLSQQSFDAFFRRDLILVRIVDGEFDEDYVGFIRYQVAARPQRAVERAPAHASVVDRGVKLGDFRLWIAFAEPLGND